MNSRPILALPLPAFPALPAFLRPWTLWLAGLLCAFTVHAQTPPAAAPAEAPPASADPALERRVMDLSAELRCLVCQNQTIADSNADLAVDLRNQVRDMLSQGQSEAEVLNFMTERYGDFVLYRPPLKGTTALLWFGPALLLVGGVGTLWFILYRRSRMAPEAFEPDDEPDLEHHREHHREYDSEHVFAPAVDPGTHAHPTPKTLPPGARSPAPVPDTKT